MPIEVKGKEPKEIFQEIKSEQLFEEGLDVDPRLVPWLYVSNILVRSLSRLVGQGPGGPIMIRAAKDGSIATVQRGGAFDDYERLDHEFAISGAERTTTGTTANHLIDAGEDFVTEGIKEGDTVFNTTDGTVAYVTAVAVGDLTLDADIMASGETYKLYPCKNFEFSRQMNRVDVFTYESKVDYQLTRDDIKPLGDKIPLLADSYYSLDFDTLKIRATLVEVPGTTPARATILGWFRAEE